MPLAPQAGVAAAMTWAVTDAVAMAVSTQHSVLCAMRHRAAADAL
jgi:hypothetical protein